MLHEPRQGQRASEERSEALMVASAMPKHKGTDALGDEVAERVFDVRDFAARNPALWVVDIDRKHPENGWREWPKKRGLSRGQGQL